MIWLSAALWLSFKDVTLILLRLRGLVKASRKDVTLTG